jgi:hypothetical protein
MAAATWWARRLFWSQQVHSHIHRRRVDVIRCSRAASATIGRAGTGSGSSVDDRIPCGSAPALVAFPVLAAGPPRGTSATLLGHPGSQPGARSRNLLVSQHVQEGGLTSYGPDSVDIFARSASYVDRILKGTKPSDLPAEAPVKYELAINLTTAKALDLAVPFTLLALADEVIE